MKIAVLIPCLNEESSIKKVVRDFQSFLPNSDIYVYDNNSTDNTFEIASAENVFVKKEYNKGKANVILSMFYDIDADYYIMVDGDDTYPAEEAQTMIDLAIKYNSDMVIADRISSGAYKSENKRLFHNFGNHLIRKLINNFFNTNIADVLTGYRVFNKRFVKNYASSIKGFELETDLTLYCLNYDFKYIQHPIKYRDRSENSVSKLNTFQDGIKIIRLFFNLYRLYKPLNFFGFIALIIFLIGLFLGSFPIMEYLSKPNHFITKVPTAILAVSLVIISILCLFCGLILDNLAKYDKRNFKQILINSK